MEAERASEPETDDQACCVHVQGAAGVEAAAHQHHWHAEHHLCPRGRARPVAVPCTLNGLCASFVALSLQTLLCVILFVSDPRCSLPCTDKDTHTHVTHNALSPPQLLQSMLEAALSEQAQRYEDELDSLRSEVETLASANTAQLRDLESQRTALELELQQAHQVNG